MNDQTVPVTIRVGSRVSVLDDVDMDSDGGWTADTVFEDTVIQYSADTGKLEFENSDMTYAQFLNLLEEYDSVQVVRE